MIWNGWLARGVFGRLSAIVVKDAGSTYYAPFAAVSQFNLILRPRAYRVSRTHVFFLFFCRDGVEVVVGLRRGHGDCIGATGIILGLIIGIV